MEEASFPFRSLTQLQQCSLAQFPQCSVAQFPQCSLAQFPQCSHWPDKVASQVLRKDHQPSSSGLQMEWEATQHKEGSSSSCNKELFYTQSCQSQFPTTKRVSATPAAATGPSPAMEVGERLGAPTR
ncbi:hypothetical protein P7K49_017526 [Saguinus oedipus]|uniref:Uncharacterized protein n=1 Tax=Saguinus oedipus TaxID=9490 RepID=A0ABQ9V2Z2_SAGOE|nr:hypothetical protein P7K49_017526 [Saguinus oedipus]